MNGPHQGMPVRHAGQALEGAAGVMVMVHGRGATAESILSLASEFDQPDFAYLAPLAADHTPYPHSWYPNSFLAPLASNEPGLSSALVAIGHTVQLATAAGIPVSSIMLLGFSQGACLALEYAARNAAQYGGVVGLSGGLIGPPGTPRDYPGSLAGVPVFLGCSDVDLHIPKARVLESAAVFRDMGAIVTERLYANMGHTVNEDEIAFVRAMMRAIGS